MFHRPGNKEGETMPKTDGLCLQIDMAGHTRRLYDFCHKSFTFHDIKEVPPPPLQLDLPSAKAM
jgi:hypothetical protein